MYKVIVCFYVFGEEGLESWIIFVYVNLGSIWLFDFCGLDWKVWLIW